MPGLPALAAARYKEHYKTSAFDQKFFIDFKY